MPFFALSCLPWSTPLSVLSPVSLTLQVYSGTSSPAVDRLCVGVRPGEVCTPRVPQERDSEHQLLRVPLLPLQLGYQADIEHKSP